MCKNTKIDEKTGSSALKILVFKKVSNTVFKK